MRNLKTITKKEIELHAAKVTQISDYIQKLLKEGETTIEAIQKANKEKIQTFDKMMTVKDIFKSFSLEIFPKDSCK